MKVYHVILWVSVLIVVLACMKTNGRNGKTTSHGGRSVVNGTQASGDPYFYSGLLATPQGKNDRGEDLWGICTTVILCSATGGSVLLSAMHCQRKLQEGASMRVVFRDEVDEDHVRNSKYYYTVKDTHAITLDQYKNDNDTVVDDGILLMKVSYPLGSHYQLAKAAPNSIPSYTDGKRYGRLIGYGGLKKGFPFNRTQGVLQFVRNWGNSIATTINPSFSEWKQSGSVYSIAGDSGGPIVRDDGTLYGIHYAGNNSTKASFMANVSSVDGKDKSEAIRNQIVEKANEYVQGCIDETMQTTAEDLTFDTSAFDEGELPSVREPEDLDVIIVTGDPSSVDNNDEYSLEWLSVQMQAIGKQFFELML